MKDKIKREIFKIKYNLLKIFGTKEQKKFIKDYDSTPYTFLELSTGSQECILEHLKKLGAKKWRKKKI